jgi:DNA polymerase epsilon subunit 1
MLYCALQSSYEDEDTRKAYSCVDLYFVTQVFFGWNAFLLVFASKEGLCLLNRLLIGVCMQDGSSFKTKYRFRPYFYVATKVSEHIRMHAHIVPWV